MGSGADTWAGSIQGTGADLQVTKIGFKPRYVRVINIDDPGTIEWVEGMDDDAGFKHVDGTQTQVTSNGITPLANGFALGADADMNVAAEQLFIVCWR